MTRFAKYEPDRTSESPPPDLSIRDATDEDVAALADIRATRGDVTPEKARAGFERCLVRVARGEMILLVAETGGAVAAYGSAARFDPPPGAPPNCTPAGWYLSGVVVAPAHRRRGIARALTHARMDRLATRAHEVYYFANELNRASIDLHTSFGFRELTRDFWHPDATFTGGAGILYRGCVGPQAPR